MALCASGEMSLGGSTVGRSVNCELGCAGTAEINMGRTDVRALADRPSGCIRMSDFYGKSAVPPFPGDSFGDVVCGGIYMGTITAAGQCYALIVAPNATGCAFCQWKTTLSATFGTGSDVDGFANTYGPMNNANHPAGNWCATRTIGGFSDWYLPAIDELATFYDNGATGNNESVIGSGEAFASPSYWSSTECSPIYSSNACILYFSTGGRYDIFKTLSFRLRAVRREPV